MTLTEDKYGQSLALGSGFFVKENVVVTALHVIEGTFHGHVKLIAEESIREIEGIVGINEMDLALLQISGPSVPALKLLDEKSKSVKVGETVYAVGNPLGLEGTFSEGTVSAVREIESVSLIQITALVSRGNSGGPVLNKYGEVIGVAIATFEGG